jgi:hypothetical protein
VSDGLQGCEWCGGPIRQPATGRRRRYCKPGHREMAYRERRTQRRIGEAVDAVAPAPRAPVDGEECPYCRGVVLGLVAHLQRCPEGPGFIS